MLLNWKPTYVFVNVFSNLGVRKGGTDAANLQRQPNKLVKTHGLLHLYRFPFTEVANQRPSDRTQLLIHSARRNHELAKTSILTSSLNPSWLLA